MDCVETNAGWVNASDNQICADVTLVTEEVLFEQGHACYDAWFAAGGESVKFKVGADQSSGKLCVCCGTGTGAPYRWSDVVKLLAVLQCFSMSVGALTDQPFKDLRLCESLYSNGTLSATMGPLVALVSAAI